MSNIKELIDLCTALTERVELLPEEMRTSLHGDIVAKMETALGGIAANITRMGETVAADMQVVRNQLITTQNQTEHYAKLLAEATTAMAAAKGMITDMQTTVVTIRHEATEAAKVAMEALNVAKEAAARPIPEAPAAKEVDMVAVTAIIREAVEAFEDRMQVFVAKESQLALNRLPIPRDGRDGRDGKDGTDGRDGTDGKDARDGTDGRNGTDGKDGKDGIDGEDGQPGSKGLDGKDGRDGESGRDGAPGVVTCAATPRDGNRYARADLIRSDNALVQASRDFVWPPGDGDVEVVIDGVTTIECDMVDDRWVKIMFKYASGRVSEKKFHVPALLYRQVWNMTKDYGCGDCVTKEGNLWIAIRDKELGMPGVPDSGWQLCVKGADIKRPAK